MKKTTLCLSILLTVIISCKEKEGETQYPASIAAGQVKGEGIKYVEVEDTICYHYCYPYKTIDLDLDGDQIPDFTLMHEASHPEMLSRGYQISKIIPLDNSFVAVSAFDEDLVDSLNFGDIIDSSNYWSDSTALLYSYHWSIFDPTQIEGYWFENDNYYIGVKMIKENYQIFGWIDYDFHNIKIRDYAIAVPYQAK